MEIILKRRYHRGGTNGKFLYGGQVICESIALPWKNNQRKVSCIPEGRYRLFVKHFPVNRTRLAVGSVTDRDGIFIHCSNDALNELQGCISPVTKATAPGKGIFSRIALERLEELVIPVIYAREEVWLVISS